LLDIGAGTTDLAVYQEGDLAHTAVFPIGSERITYPYSIIVYPPIDLDICVKVEYAFYLVYYPEGTGGTWEGEPIYYERVSYTPLPIIGMISNVVNIRSEKTPYP